MKIDIKDFGEQNELEFEVLKRTDPNLPKYYVHFKKIEVKERNIYAGVSGNGNTIDQATKDYCKRISNTLLVKCAFDPYERKTIVCPQLTYYTKGEINKKNKQKWVAFLNNFNKVHPSKRMKFVTENYLPPTKVKPNKNK